MTDDETLDTAGQDLGQARARIEAAREALQAALDGQVRPRSSRPSLGSTAWQQGWRRWSKSSRDRRR